jgi:hypothetical protein
LQGDGFSGRKPKRNPVAINATLIVLSVLLALDCLYVAALLVANAVPRIRRWAAVPPSRESTPAGKPSAWRWPERYGQLLK